MRFTSKLDGVENFTDGLQLAFRKTIASKLSVPNEHVIICSITYGEASRRLLWDRRRLIVAPITFETQVFSSSYSEALNLKAAYENLSTSSIFVEFDAQVGQAKSSGLIPESYTLAGVTLTNNAAQTTNEAPVPTPSPTPEPEHNCGELRKTGDGLCALDVFNMSNVDINAKLSTVDNSLISKVTIYFEEGMFVSQDTIDLDRFFDTSMLCNGTSIGACTIKLDSVEASQSTLISAVRVSNVEVTGMHLTHACIGIGVDEVDNLSVTNTLFTKFAENETATLNYCGAVDINGAGIHIQNSTNITVHDCEIRDAYSGVFMEDVRNADFSNLKVEETHQYSVVIRGETGSTDVVFRDSTFSKAKDASVYIKNGHRISFFDCSFVENWNAAIFVSKGKEITIERSGFTGNNYRNTNANELEPILNDAVVWLFDKPDDSYDNSFMVKMRDNTIDMAGFSSNVYQSGELVDILPVGYKQQTYTTGSLDNLIFSELQGKETLDGGAEYDNYRFTNVFNNSVSCGDCLTSYYAYFSNQPGYSTVLPSPFAPPPTPGTPTDEGGFTNTQVGAAAAGGVAFVVVAGNLAFNPNFA